jgi:hypothetical protein
MAKIIQSPYSASNTVLKVRISVLHFKRFRSRVSSVIQVTLVITDHVAHLQKELIIPCSPNPEPRPPPPPATFYDLPENRVLQLAQAGHLDYELEREYDARMSGIEYVERIFDDLNEEEKLEIARKKWEARNVSSPALKQNVSTGLLTNP